MAAVPSAIGPAAVAERHRGTSPGAAAVATSDPSVSGRPLAFRSARPDGPPGRPRRSRRGGGTVEPSLARSGALEQSSCRPGCRCPSPARGRGWRSRRRRWCGRRRDGRGRGRIDRIDDRGVLRPCRPSCTERASPSRHHAPGARRCCPRSAGIRAGAVGVQRRRRPDRRRSCRRGSRRRACRCRRHRRSGRSRCLRRGRRPHQPPTIWSSPPRPASRLGPVRADEDVRRVAAVDLVDVGADVVALAGLAVVGLAVEADGRRDAVAAEVAHLVVACAAVEAVGAVEARSSGL